MTTEFDIAIIGFPNAGKSTLLNALVGAPLAAVSSAAGTTRRRVWGISLLESAQGKIRVNWLDTPGFFHQAKRRELLERRMHEEAINTLAGADLVMVVIDAKDPIVKIKQRTADIKRIVGDKKVDVVLLNKADMLKNKAIMLPLTASTYEVFAGADIIPISALRGQGLDTVKEVLVRMIQTRALSSQQPVEPQNQKAVPDEDLLTQDSQRMIAMDWVRGALLEGLREEVPMSLDVLIESFEETEKDITIRAVVFVERDSQKAIIIGKGASRLKAAGQYAREVLTDLFDKKVHLFTHVQVKERWSEKEGWLNELGY